MSLMSGPFVAARYLAMMPNPTPVGLLSRTSVENAYDSYAWIGRVLPSDQAEQVISGVASSKRDITLLMFRSDQTVSPKEGDKVYLQQGSLDSQNWGLWDIQTEDAQFNAWVYKIKGLWSQDVTPLSITPTGLPDATIGDTYDETVTASGGYGVITYTISDGSLPPGLALDSATGEITGVPITAGAYAFTITATDAGKQWTTAAYAVNIVAVGTEHSVAFTNASLAERVQLTNASIFNLASNVYSLCMWFRITWAGSGNFPILVGQYSTNDPLTGDLFGLSDFIQLELANHSHLYWDHNGSYRTYTLSTPIMTNTWYHLALSRSAAGDTGDLYLNGVLETSYAGTLGNINERQHTVLGFANGSVGSYKHLGLVHDLLIYNLALTGAQIAAIYVGGAPPTVGLEGRWKFYEGAGIIAADSSGNGNDGALVGGASWSTDVP